MPLIKIILGLMLVVSFLLVMIGLNCTNESDDDSDDDDNNDIGDDDDSASDSCHTVINPEADEAKATAMNYSTADIADCLPELPDPIYEDQLAILLEGYLGQYHSEIGTIRTISCRPDGEWIIPNYDAQDLWCGWSYEIPLWIEVEENTDRYSGTITYNFSIWEENVMDIFNAYELLKINIGDYEYYAFGEMADKIVWEFHYSSNLPLPPPEEEREGFITWTKDESFEE